MSQADIKEKDDDICHQLESMIDSIHGVKESTPPPTPSKELHRRQTSYISDTEEMEDYGSCSSRSDTSLPPSHSPSIGALSNDDDTRKRPIISFDDEDEDLGVFV